jgi:predicted nucleic acid-binding protein
MKSKKVILDTNLWISFLISKQLDFIDDLLVIKKIGKTKIMHWADFTKSLK